MASRVSVLHYYLLVKLPHFIEQGFSNLRESTRFMGPIDMIKVVKILLIKQWKALVWLT